jgi:hypothetical protein
MLKQLSLALCLLSALFIVGCSKAENANNHNVSANANRPATTATTPATTTPASTASGEKIGVAECDDFIAKYDECVSAHVPEAARAQYKASINTWRTQWQKLAANPQTKATLAQACKTAAEQQRTAMKSYKCTF